MIPLDQLIFDSSNIVAVNYPDTVASLRTKKASIIVQVHSLNTGSSKPSQLALVGEFRFFDNPSTTKCLARFWLPDNLYIASIEQSNGFGYCRHSVALAKCLESIGLNWNIELSGRGIDNLIFIRLFNSLGFNSPYIIRINCNEL